MNTCTKFAKQHPFLIAGLTTLLVYVLLALRDLLPFGLLHDGISEVLMAAVVFIWTFLFMGREKVAFRNDGFRYAFRFFRGYLIAMTVFCALLFALTLFSGFETSKLSVRILNVFLVGAAVGIVEEFTFRGLVFGGILHKLGNSKRSVVTAAVVSGLIFGAMHIIFPLLSGEVSDLNTLLAAVGKTCQTGIFGMICAFVYFKTRNIYAVSAVHCLNDLVLFLATVGMKEGARVNSYVSGSSSSAIGLITYVFFTLVMVPMLVRCIRETKENEACPFDDDFAPRAVEYEKRAKKTTVK